MSINLFNKCISELLKNRKNHFIDIEPIYQYLKSFKSFIFLLKNQTSLTIEKLLTEISNDLELRKITKNELIFQQGELAENFYIILKGNLKVLKLRPYEYYMTNEEYISFLLDLRMNNQSEIIRQSKHYNNLIYPIPENFDNFVKNLSNKVAGGIYIDMHQLIEKAVEVNKYINQEEEIKQKNNNMKLSPKEYIQKFKVSNDIINNTEIISNFINEKNIITDSNEIDKIKLLMKDRKKVIIPNYEEFIHLSTGNIFEDQAFEHQGNYYHSSVISLDDDGYLGYINKKKYNLLIHESVEKRNKKIFMLLVYLSFMKSNNQFLFEKKYLTFINDQVFDVNHELFKEGEKSEYTYFVTEGEYELSMNKNIIEVNEMIIEYKKILMKLNVTNKSNKQIFDFVEEKRQNNDLILNKKFRNDGINELLMKKRYIKLNIIHKKDILGLSDVYAYNRDETESKKELLIYESVKKKCLFTCKCLNSNCHAFYLPNSIFNNLYHNEGNYNLISKNIEYKKICSIIERLQIYKKSVFDLVNKTQNKLSKRVTILREISKTPKFNTNNFIRPKMYKNIIKEMKESIEQNEKMTEITQKQMQILKHNFNLLKSNKGYKNSISLYPSIIREQHSNKNVISLKKRNKASKSINLPNNSNMLYKTYNTNFKKLYIKNILYENLFYNYTINNNIINNEKINSSFAKIFNKNNSFANKNEINYKNNINNKHTNTDVNNINLSVKKKLIMNNKNLIGCYDPLAFDKFNRLFSFHFRRHMNDANINKTNDDN